MYFSKRTLGINSVYYFEEAEEEHMGRYVEYGKLLKVKVIWV